MRHLTKAEAERRLAMYHEGLSDRAIADAMGVEGTAILRWRRNMGLPSNFPALGTLISSAGHDERRRLHAQGLSASAIARRVGVSAASMSTWRRKHNLPGYHDGAYVDRAENAARMLLYQLGWSDAKVARTRQVSRAAISAWRQRRKLPANYVHAQPMVKQAEWGTLAQRIRKAVGYGLAQDIAEETAAELCLALLSGDLNLEEVEREAHRFGNRTLERFANRFGPRSIDEEISEDGVTLLDTMADERSSSWLEEMGATVW